MDDAMLIACLANCEAMAALSLAGSNGVESYGLAPSLHF